MPLIAFDSNVLTAFIRANNADLQGSSAEVEERVAAFRLFLHATPMILPMVAVEANKIRDSMKAREHWQFIASAFEEFFPDLSQERIIENRTVGLLPHHRKTMDRRILAEAEVGAVGILV